MGENAGIKIIVTVSDSADAAHLGGEVSRMSSIIEIPPDKVPTILRQHLVAEKYAKDKGSYYWGMASFSLLVEEEEEEDDQQGLEFRE